MNRTVTEELARCTIPHNFAEWVDTGGGVHNLIVHTLTDQTTAGPKIAVGPFSPDGSLEFPDTLYVFDDDDGPDESTEVHDIDALANAMRREYRSCEWCMGEGCKSCGDTGIDSSVRGAPADVELGWRCICEEENAAYCAMHSCGTAILAEVAPPASRAH